MIYVPLEKYRSRQTEYSSDAFLACVKRHPEAIQVESISGGWDRVKEIKSGVAVDTYERSTWGFTQIECLIRMIESGSITSETIIFFEDFWHPGMEMLPYTCALKGVRPKVYAFCHAQSVDPWDFTRKMLPWIRHFEKGWAEWLTGVFVASSQLKDMLVEGRVCRADKIHVVGLEFDRQTLLTKFYAGWDCILPLIAVPKRDKTVLFTSRLDPEKQPEVFFALVKYCRDHHGGEVVDWKFRILGGRPVSQEWHAKAEAYGISLRDDLDKREYFEELSRAAVVFNCAKQDFVSYGLLDALAYGCFPLYPNYLTFPDVLRNNPKLLYHVDPVDFEEVFIKLKPLVETQAEQLVLQRWEVPTLFKAYGEYYESTVERMLDVML